MSKPVILGKPRSQPKKVLLRAQTEAELAAMILGQEEAIAQHYRLTLTGDNLIQTVFLGLRDPDAFKFAFGLTGAEFDLSRLQAWKEYRVKYPAGEIARRLST